MKIVRLEPGVPSATTLDQLRGKPVYLSRPNTHVQDLLARLGITFEIATSEAPDDAVLVILDSPVEELVGIVDRLLGPGGCPWDQAQTHESLKKYLLEEAYEVLDAIDEGSEEKLREELGDLLLQPFMHSQISKKNGGFDADDIGRAICEKLVRRHPHVFADLEVADANEVLRNWDAIKKAEKGSEGKSILDGVPKGMASLLRAHEVGKRAARAGFEWPHIDAVFDKLREEEIELRQALSVGSPQEIESEIGDLLFTVVNVARWAGVEPEEALRKMLNRFTERFRHMEASISEAAISQELIQVTPERWDELWNQAKSSEAVKACDQ